MRQILRYSAGCLALVILSHCAVFGADRRIDYTNGSKVMIGDNGELVAFSKGLLAFYNSAGERIAAKKLRNNEMATLPEGGEVVGLIRYRDHQPTTLKPASFELYNLNGQRLYRLKNPPFASVVISPTGTAFVGLDGVEGLPGSTLLFHDAKGNQQAAISVEYYLGGRFSADGSVFVFATAKDGVLAYSAGGEVLDGYGTGSTYDFSADGRVMAVWHDGSLRIYNGSTRVKTLATDKNIRAIAVAPDGGFVGWAGERRAEIIALDTTIARLILSLDTPGENYRSLAISNGHDYVAVGIDIDRGKSAPTEKRHTAGRAEIYTMQGMLLHSQPVSYAVWNAKTPLVKFPPQDNRLAVITREATEFIDLSQTQLSK